MHTVLASDQLSTNGIINVFNILGIHRRPSLPPGFGLWNFASSLVCYGGSCREGCLAFSKVPTLEG